MRGVKKELGEGEREKSGRRDGRRTRSPLDLQADVERRRVHRRALPRQQVALCALLDDGRDLADRDGALLCLVDAVADAVEALDERVREQERVDVLELHDELSDARLDRARPASGGERGSVGLGERATEERTERRTT